MRNLKKLISLLLVVAMIASLGIAGIFTASAAEEEVSAYVSESKIILRTGIFQGYPDGTIGYQKPVTRAEAAAIVARTLLGVGIADSLVVAETTFSDVPEWASKYVNYLAKQGIINGRSETIFDPNAPVTSIEFAKMMLCALGYGKHGEYTGAGWDVATLVDANEIGIIGTAFTDFDLTDPATREECMVYTYNALFSNTVTYNNNRNQYETADGIINAKHLADIHGVSTSVASDDYGRFILTYSIGNYTLEIAYPGIYDGDELNSDILYGLFGKNIANVLKDAYVDVFVDGVKTSADATEKVLSEVWQGDLYANTLKKYGVGRSANVEIYGRGGRKSDIEYIRYLLAGGSINKFVTDWTGTNVSFVIYYEHVGKITATSTTKNGDVKYTLDTTYPGSDKKVSFVDNDLNAKVNQYVSYTIGVNNGNVDPENVKVVTPRTGKFTGTGTSGTGTHKETYYTIDGEKYYLSAACDVNELDEYGEYSFILDSHNNIVRIELVEATTADYLYVKAAKAAKIDNTWKPFITTDGGLAINVVYGNGGNDTLYFQVQYNGSRYYVEPFGEKGGRFYLSTDTDATAAQSAIPAGWYSYTIDKNGYVTLAETKPNYARTYVESSDYDPIKDTKIVIDDEGTSIKWYVTDENGEEVKVEKTANSDTVQYIIGSNGNLTTKKGYNRFKKITADPSKVLYVYGKNGTDLYAIYIYDEVDNAETSKNYGYLLNKGETDADGTEYTFILEDGKELKTKIKATYTEGKIYIVQSINGVYSASLASDGITPSNFIWYDTDEEKESGDMIPVPQFTIGDLQKDYFITSQYDKDGKDVETSTYWLAHNYAVINVTEYDITALAEGQGFIAHLNAESKIDIIWIVYAPAE